MDDDYLLKHLREWVPLFYGEQYRKYAVAFKRGKRYVFGFEKGTYANLNMVDKPIAIYLSVSILPKLTQPLKRKRLR